MLALRPPTRRLFTTARVLLADPPSTDVATRARKSRKEYIKKNQASNIASKTEAQEAEEGVWSKPVPYNPEGITIHSLQDYMPAVFGSRLGAGAMLRRAEERAALKAPPRYVWMKQGRRKLTEGEWKGYVEGMGGRFKTETGIKEIMQRDASWIGKSEEVVEVLKTRAPQVFGEAQVQQKGAQQAARR